MQLEEDNRVDGRSSQRGIEIAHQVADEVEVETPHCVPDDLHKRGFDR